MADQPPTIGNDIPRDTVAAKDVDGSVIYIPLDQVDAAKKAGATILSPEQHDQEIYGGPAGKIGAAALGALDTLTMGGATAAAGELGLYNGGYGGRVANEQTIAAIKKANPISTIAGEALPFLAMPGAQGEGAVVAGEGLAASAANLTLPHFMRGAAESAAMQTGAGISEDLINHDYAGQSWFAHAATPETLFSGVLSAGLGAGLSKMSASIKGAGRALGTGAEAEDAGHVGEAIAMGQRSGYTSEEASSHIAQVKSLATHAAVGGEQRTLVDSLFDSFQKSVPMDNKYRGALRGIYDSTRDAAEAPDRILDANARSAMKELNQVFNGLDSMDEHTFALKEAHVSKLIDPTRITNQVDAANVIHRSLIESLEELSGSMDARVGDVKKFRTIADKLQDATADAADASRGGSIAQKSGSTKLFMALDDLKRVVGRNAQFGIDEVEKSSFGRSMDEFYHQMIIPALEDDGLWGQRLARMQADNNAEVSKGIVITGKLKSIFGESLESAAGRKQYSAKLESLRTALGDLDHTPSADALEGTKAGILQRGIDTVRSRAAAMANTMELDAGQTSKLKATVEAANRLEAIMKKAHGDAQNARAMRELIERSTGGGGIGMAALVGHAIGGPTGGVLGAAVRGITGLIQNPAKAAKMLGGLKKFELSARKLIARDARSAVRGETIVGGTSELSQEDARLAMKEIGVLAGQPQTLVGRLEGLVNPVGDVAPKTAAAAAATACRLIQYLSSSSPPPLPPKFMDREPRWTDQDVVKFKRQLRTGLHPFSALEDMQSGRLHEDQRAVLEQVYPDLYDDMRMQLMQEYKKAHDDGALDHLTAQDKKMMSIMLGVSLDYTHSPEFGAAMQQSAMRDPMTQGAMGSMALGGKPNQVKMEDTVKALKTDSDKLKEAT